jgi:hypothetical protein
MGCGDIKLAIQVLNCGISTSIFRIEEAQEIDPITFFSRFYPYTKLHGIMKNTVFWK